MAFLNNHATLNLYYLYITTCFEFTYISHYHIKIIFSQYILINIRMSKFETNLSCFNCHASSFVKLTQNISQSQEKKKSIKIGVPHVLARIGQKLTASNGRGSSHPHLLASFSFFEFEAKSYYSSCGACMCYKVRFFIGC